MISKREAAALAEKINKMLSSLAASTKAADDSRAAKLQETLDAIDKLCNSDLREMLQGELTECMERISAALQERRKQLHAAARQKGWMTKRIGDRDRVEFFQLAYRGSLVRVMIGDELLEEFTESSGPGVLE